MAPQICPTCSKSDFWISVYGIRNCRICLPPIDESQIADSGPAPIPSPVGPAQPIPGGVVPTSVPTSVPTATHPPSIDTAAELVILPRHVSWPSAVYSLPWPDGSPPGWLDWRLEARFVARRTGKDITHVPVDWIRPSWIGYPDPAWPQPKRRWAPNDLPACWYCGLTLFWRDLLDDERCAICSPPREGEVVCAWWLKEGPAISL